MLALETSFACFKVTSFLQQRIVETRLQTLHHSIRVVHCPLSASGAYLLGCAHFSFFRHQGFALEMSVQQRPRGRGRGQNGQPSRGHGDPSSNPYGTDKTEPRSRQISPHRSAQIVTPSVANQSRKSSKTRGLRSVRGAREAGQTAPSPLSKEVKFDSGEQSWRDPSIAGGTEYKDRMHDLWQSVRIDNSYLLTGGYS